MSVIAKESGHWYKRDGTPCYEVPYAKTNKEKAGQLRPTTKGDAKKLDLVGSVTEIGKMMYKFNLERWKQEQILESAFTCPLKRDEVSGEEWIKRVFEDSKEHAKVTAEQGKDIHGDIEWFMRKNIVRNENNKNRCYEVWKILGDYGIPRSAIEAEKTFATDLWGGYGGMIDLPAISKNFIADVKTKDFTLIDGKPHKQKDDTYVPYQLHYDENCLQLVMYAVGVGIFKTSPSVHAEVDGEPHWDFKFPTLINIYVSRIDDSVFVHEWSEKDILKALAKAELLTKLWWLDF